MAFGWYLAHLFGTSPILLAHLFSSHCCGNQRLAHVILQQVGLTAWSLLLGPWPHCTQICATRKYMVVNPRGSPCQVGVGSPWVNAPLPFLKQTIQKCGLRISSVDPNGIKLSCPLEWLFPSPFHFSQSPFPAAWAHGPKQSCLRLCFLGEGCALRRETQASTNSVLSSPLAIVHTWANLLCNCDFFFIVKSSLPPTQGLLLGILGMTKANARETIWFSIWITDAKCNSQIGSPKLVCMLESPEELKNGLYLYPSEIVI